MGTLLLKPTFLISLRTLSSVDTLAILANFRHVRVLNIVSMKTLVTTIIGVLLLGLSRECVLLFCYISILVQGQHPTSAAQNAVMSHCCCVEMK